MAVLLGSIKEKFYRISTKTGKRISVTPSIVDEVKQFIEYCNSFYNKKGGVYPIATKNEIEKAVYIFMTMPKNTKVEFDSFDREKVREIIGK